jgi:hypothetical protein
MALGFNELFLMAPEKFTFFAVKIIRWQCQCLKVSYSYKQLTLSKSILQ